MNLKDLVFDDEFELIPVVVQDASSLEVLTLAYMSEESLQRTIDSGETWFWSRSRNQLWHKGETSGHTQRVVSMTLDCDADALRVMVEPKGPACHTGERSCFHNALVEKYPHAEQPHSSLGKTLTDLYSIVGARKRELPESSYTAYLFKQGLDKILKKLGEECAETLIAAKNEDPEALIGETCDLLYHLTVLLVEREITWDDISTELISRK
ncbi:MAG TPA: bifunctional phosphoribosyl-AMP cyclohydrolase/phosphoribosyl-ATP diphosphatase HisIE [Pyrinomonadaceae bacterium]|nr:bifunctional phosphoribosyl-AMP cyclohydrolase/phosphoribosyl-ATP diphosphatase HisIE [Pyrinomonadaceae bacterium]